MFIVLFTGAGASVELGVPAMRTMAEKFVRHLQDQGFPSESLDVLKKSLEDEHYDMEHVIEELDNLENVRRNGEKWGIDTGNLAYKKAETLRQEAEWLIGHLCERVDVQAAMHMWGETLFEGAKSHLTIVTTNYDRAIEMAAAQISVRLNDGFNSFDSAEFAEWKGIQSSRSECVEVLKLHGSTDWYHNPNSDMVYKLRHPMPLFGQLRIVMKVGPGVELRSAAVLPSREKKVNELPYPDLSALFRSRANEASSIVFVGTSMRDPDIRSLCAQQSLKKPVYVVSRSGRSDVIPESARVIQQSASKFLVSTLPRYFRQNDPNYLDRECDNSIVESKGVLQAMLNAFDSNADTSKRCDAIESLAKSRIALSRRNLEKLLRSKDPDVSKFALGLFSDSPDRKELLEIAQALVSERKADFASEMELLEKQLKTSSSTGD